MLCLESTLQLALSTCSTPVRTIGVLLAPWLSLTRAVVSDHTTEGLFRHVSLTRHSRHISRNSTLRHTAVGAPAGPPSGASRRATGTSRPRCLAACSARCRLRPWVHGWSAVRAALCLLEAQWLPRSRAWATKRCDDVLVLAHLLARAHWVIADIAW